MKRFFFLIPLAAMLLLSCSEHDRNASSPAEVVVTHKKESASVAKTVARLSIQGMTCSAGCGGKIQQDLRALNGVAGTDLDFQEGRPENIVTVEYNPSVLSEQEMIKCVAGIGDGQYQVKSVEVIDFEVGSSGGSSSSSSVESGGFGRVFQVLNLLQSVARMVQG